MTYLALLATLHESPNPTRLVGPSGTRLDFLGLDFRFTLVSSVIFSIFVRRTSPLTDDHSRVCTARTTAVVAV